MYVPAPRNGPKRATAAYHLRQLDDKKPDAAIA
jgi:hypothetical protein